MWTNTELSWKRAASESAFFSAIQRHLVFERVRISCSAAVGAGAALCCAEAGAEYARESATSVTTICFMFMGVGDWACVIGSRPSAIDHPLRAFRVAVAVDRDSRHGR